MEGLGIGEDLTRALAILIMLDWDLKFIALAEENKLTTYVPLYAYLWAEPSKLTLTVSRFKLSLFSHFVSLFSFFPFLFFFLLWRGIGISLGSNFLFFLL